MAFFLTLPGLVVGLVALGALDRLGWWLHEHHGFPWRRDGRRPATALGLDEVQALFQPSNRHRIEQRKVELVLGTQDENGAPPRVRVDLDRQIVTIPARRAGSPEA